VALALGLVADAAGTLAGALRGPSGSSRWRALVPSVRGPRPSPLEVAGALAAVGGGGMAAASAMGGLPGSAPLVYLSLVVTGAGVRLANAPRPADPALAPRPEAWGAWLEPALLLGLGAGFIRWQTSDLGVVRGVQAVLGPGITLPPPARGGPGPGHGGPEAASAGARFGLAAIP